MIYKTFKRRPYPCISVKLKILPHDILFKILVVACPTFGFLVLGLTAIPISGTVSIIAGFRNLFQATWVPQKTGFVLFQLILLRVEILLD